MPQTPEIAATMRGELASPEGTQEGKNTCHPQPHKFLMYHSAYSTADSLHAYFVVLGIIPWTEHPSLSDFGR